MGFGTESSPRGMPVTELTLPTVLTLLDPRRPFVMSKIRRCNYRFGLMEAAWMLGGSNELAVLTAYNKKMADFSDDGETLWGAYGPRLKDQLPWVVNTLKHDPFSRQAIITTWRPEVQHLTTRTKDVPCTVAWHFQLRDNQLDLTVFMRSNDAWLGLPYDILSFTTVQRVVASMLGVELGVYNHVPSNLHVYAQHYSAAQEVLNELHFNDDVPTVEDFGVDGMMFEDVDIDFVSSCFLDVALDSVSPEDLSTKGFRTFVSAVLDDLSDPVYKALRGVRERG